MLRIDRVIEAGAEVLQVSGHLKSEDLAEFARELNESGRGAALDLEGIFLVDVDAVRFLASCQANGVKLLRCPPFIRQWMIRELDR